VAEAEREIWEEGGRGEGRKGERKTQTIAFAHASENTLRAQLEVLHL